MNQGTPPPDGPAGGASSPSAQRRALLALAERFKVPAFDLAAAHFPLAGLEFVPREIAERHVLLPVQLRADELFVAMADPTKKKVLEELAFVSGRQVHAYVADPVALRAAIDKAYRAYAAGETHYSGPRATQGGTPSMLLKVAPPAAIAAAKDPANKAANRPAPISSPALPALTDDDLPSVLAFDELEPEEKEPTKPRLRAYEEPAKPVAAPPPKAPTAPPRPSKLPLPTPSRPSMPAATKLPLPTPSTAWRTSMTPAAPPAPTPSAAPSRPPVPVPGPSKPPANSSVHTAAGSREDLGALAALDVSDEREERTAPGVKPNPRDEDAADLRVKPEGSLGIDFSALTEALGEDDEDQSESPLPAPRMDPHLSLAVDVRTLSKMLRVGRSDPPPSTPAPGLGDFRGSSAPEPDEDFEADLAFTPRGTLKTVLVVDEDAETRTLLRRVLGDKGYRVVEATSGSAALSQVQSDTPDAIILEALLPGVHGFDVCRRIKGSERYGHVPIVMLSSEYRGWRYAADLESAYRVSAFLEKPFRVSELLGALERAIAGDRARRPNEGEEPLSPEAEQALAASMERVRAGDQDAAVAELEQGVQVDPKAFRLHYSLALLAGRRGDVYRAIRALEAAIELQPRSFAALKNLAVLYQQAGLRRKASELWERAREHSPDEATRAQVEAHLLGLLRTPPQ